MVEEPQSSFLSKTNLFDETKPAWGRYMISLSLCAADQVLMKPPIHE